MLMKLLLTLSVIIGAVLVLKARTQRRLELPTNPVRVINTPQPSKRRLWLMTATALVLLGVSGIGFYIYHQWQDGYREVTLTVVDSQTGHSVKYHAYKGDIEGRQFVTTDGRDVTLAETERLEISR